MELSPLDLPDGAGASHRGQQDRREPARAAFMGPPHPSPRRGFVASGRRFGRVSRCSAYGMQGQPGTVGREGVKSAEGGPRPWLTFNLAPHTGGLIKSTNGRWVSNPPRLSVAQRTPEDSSLRGFSLFGANIQFRDYLDIRVQVDNCQPTKAQITDKGTRRRRLKGPSPRANRVEKLIGTRAHWVNSTARGNLVDMITF